MTEADTRMSDRDRLRSLATTLRDATIPKEGESERALEICWKWMFELLEVKVEVER